MALPAAEYVRQITALAPDRLARAAFQDLVLRLASPGATLFDFGAGPGIDARYFAERGFRVEAYDIDASMREHFSSYCRDFIDSGRIRLDCSAYADFLNHSATASPVELVISNFAPLSLVKELRELFAKFHAITSPGGKILASVLNPYFAPDMKHRWFWRDVVPGLWHHGQFRSEGPQGFVYRRRLAFVSAQARPYFKLSRVLSANDIDLSRRSRNWFGLLTSRFMFLLFEKG